MIETNLTDALCDFIRESLTHLSLETQSGIHRPPEVIPGYLPPKRSRAAEDFPFVIVRAENASCNRGETEATVVLIVGCYSQETDGYAYCLHVMQHLRLALLTLEDQTLAGKYQLAFPIDWDNVPEQPYPLWQIQMTTRWVFNTAQLPAIEGEFDDN